MWEKISKKFSDYPAREAVAKKMIEYGLRIGNKGKIFCGDIEIKDSALAKSVGVDRRAVRTTIDAIRKDDELKILFANILPAGALLKNVAKELGYGAVEIEADAKKPGILAACATLLAKRQISIKQAHADDPALVEKPKLTIITEKKIPGEIINEFLKIDGVKKVSII
ncbi:MAG: hypothetical protein QXF35_00790 [Candidatus Bilamarchaeaceae archaeon]